MEGSESPIYGDFIREINVCIETRPKYSWKIIRSEQETLQSFSSHGVGF